MNEFCKRLTQQYGALFQDISVSLFEADPIGINFGTNVDEYDSEAEAIIARLYTCNSSADVAQVVYEAFCLGFDVESVGRKESYTNVSEKIWHIWLTHRV